MSKFGGFITLCVGVAAGYSIKKYSPKVKRAMANKLSKWILGSGYPYYQPPHPCTPYWSYPYYFTKDTFIFEDLYHARRACQEITARKLDSRMCTKSLAIKVVIAILSLKTGGGPI